MRPSPPPAESIPLIDWAGRLIDPAATAVGLGAPTARTARVPLVVGVLGLVLAGCTAQVAQRVDAARVAVETARVAGAPIGSTELFRVAEQNVKEGESLLSRANHLDTYTADARATTAIVAAWAAVITSKLQGEVDRVAAEMNAARQEASRATTGAKAAADAARVADARTPQAGRQSQQAQVRTEQGEMQTSEFKPQAASIPPPVTFIRYVVKRGDTLPKIAARSEIYGDAHQWMRIYEANTEVVGRDRKLQTGLVLLIVTP